MYAKMKLLRIVVFYCGLLLRDCESYFYPPLFWQRENCGFSRLRQIKDSNITKEYFINVVPSTAMNIICPSYVTVNNWLQTKQSQQSMLENMWLVDKEGYDKCSVNEKGDPKFNKLVMVCNTPLEFSSKMFAFHPRYNVEEPRFAPGQHYYFISTSRGYRDELKTRKVSGPNGGCKRYHMKLHIYVCDTKKEDCIWEMPRCDPPAEVYREMIMIDGKLPAPTQPPTVEPKTRTTKSIPIRKTKKSTIPRQAQKTPKPKRKQFYDPKENEIPAKICAKKDEETSIHLILNFVLGGVALFMVIVIIILACGLSSTSREYNVERRTSIVSSLHEPNKYAYVETLRYPDAHVQQQLGSRAPLGSPQSNYLIYTRPIEPIPESASLRTPRTYDGRVFIFPEVPDHNQQVTTNAHVEPPLQRSHQDLGPAPV